MAKTINCLAFDLGASGGRAILGRFDGSRLHVDQLHRFPNAAIRIADHLYWDAVGLFEQVKRGLAAAAKDHARDLHAVGLDTWGLDFGLLGPDETLVGCPHAYRDPRTVGMMDKAFRSVSRDEIYQRTGIQFQHMNTLYQLYAMVVQQAPQLKVADTFLMMADLLNFWLCGRKVCEFTNATTTQCYDPIAGTWAQSVLEALDIPTNILPPIVPPGTVLGNLSAWLADEVAIKQVPVIAVASHDTASAVIAVPAETGDHAFLSSGTWSLLGAEVTQPVINEAGSTHNFSCYGGACGTFLVWKNTQALWLLQECQRLWAQTEDNVSYEQLTELAAKAKPFGPLVDSDDRLFLAPGNMPQRIQMFCQQTHQDPPDSHASVVRCILESLAAKYRWVLERLELVVERQLQTIHIIGGGSRNPLLSALTADATGRRVVAGPAEATAIGNIAMQLMTLGHIASLDEARQVIRNSFDTIVYEPRNTLDWEKHYSRFCELMERDMTDEAHNGSEGNSDGSD